MSILPDRFLLASTIVAPCAPQTRTSYRGPVVSYGVSSYGYDLRLDTEFFRLKKRPWWKWWGLRPHLDPKAPPEETASLYEQFFSIDPVVIPPHGFVLARTYEDVKVPRECLAIVLGKSTYARCAILVNTTPLEPEWRGKVTLEISNTADVPAVIYPHEGIAQVIFLKADDVCAQSYADKGGRYQDQKAVTLPCV